MLIADEISPVPPTLHEGAKKAEVVHRRGARRSRLRPPEWVDWFNHHRLFEAIGKIPAAEAENQHHAAADNIDMAA